MYLAGMMRCLLAALLLLLGNPASASTFSTVSAGQGAKVGIVSLVGPELTIIHVGFTPFTSFNNRLPNDWGLDRTARTSTAALLRQGGYEVVDISVDASTARGIRNEDDWSSLNDTGLGRDWSGLYGKLLTDNRLAALVVLREQTMSGGGRNTYRGYGIFSGRRPELFVSVTADVIGGNPAHRSIARCVAAPIFDEKRMANQNLEEISAIDIPWAKAELGLLMQKKIAFELSSSGLLSSGSPCPGFSPDEKKK